MNSWNCVLRKNLHYLLFTLSLKASGNGFPFTRGVSQETEKTRNTCNRRSNKRRKAKEIPRMMLKEMPGWHLWYRCREQPRSPSEKLLWRKKKKKIDRISEATEILRDDLDQSLANCSLEVKSTIAVLSSCDRDHKV